MLYNNQNCSTIIKIVRQKSKFLLTFTSVQMLLGFLYKCLYKILMFVENVWFLWKNFDFCRKILIFVGKFWFSFRIRVFQKNYQISKLGPFPFWAALWIGENPCLFASVGFASCANRIDTISGYPFTVAKSIGVIPDKIGLSESIMSLIGHPSSMYSKTSLRKKNWKKKLKKNDLNKVWK